MIYSVDQYGVYRKHDDDLSILSLVAPIESDPEYQAMRTWVVAAGEFYTFVSTEPQPMLDDYRKKAFLDLLEAGNKFVKGLTSDMLECEIQTFPILVEQAKLYQAGVRGPEVLQITIQEMMTGHTAEQVAARTLQLYTQQNSVVSIMSSMRQNVRDMLLTCTTHEQVDLVVEQAKATGRAAVAQILQELENG